MGVGAGHCGRRGELPPQGQHALFPFGLSFYSKTEVYPLLSYMCIILTELNLCPWAHMLLLSRFSRVRLCDQAIFQDKSCSQMFMTLGLECLSLPDEFLNILKD